MNENLNVQPYESTSIQDRSFLSQVYLWMTLGLLITAGVAVYVASSPMLMIRIITSDGLFFGFILGELALVWYMSARVHKMSLGQLSFGMLAYAVLNGVTLSVVFWAYTQGSIASVFFITAGTFGLMSLIGYTTKRDLTGMGQFMLMGLIGMILASLVNMFFKSPAIYWVATYAGVVIFAGLTAYDTQKLKRLAGMEMEVEEGKKLALMGALTLYLDFINLFLLLLRVLGRRK